MKLRHNMIQEFANAVNDLEKTHDYATYYWVLGTDDNDNRWAIVLSWSDSYEAICTKLAYQPNNSIMSDYDIDWLMPYDEESGEVYDTELSLYSNVNIAEIEWVIDWLLNIYNQYYF